MARKKPGSRTPQEKLHPDAPAGEQELFTFGVEPHIWASLPEPVRNRLATRYIAEHERKKKDALWFENTKKELRGRPTKYEPWMDDAVLEVYARGGTDSQAATAIGVSEDTLLLWHSSLNPDGENEEKLYPTFSGAVDKGRKKSREWWISQGQEAIDGRPFNAGLYALMMANLHDFRTAKEDRKHEGEVKHTLTWNDIVKSALEEENKSGSSKKPSNPQKSAT